MKSFRIPAEIILTFPTQTKATPEIVNTASFACEQHLNSIGMITYNGPMLPTGTLSFGLRVHMQDPVESRGQVLEMFPSKIEPDESA